MQCSPPFSRTLSILRVGPRVTTSAQCLCTRLSRVAWESRKRAARCLAYSCPWSMRFIRSRESGARWTIMAVVVVVLNFRPFHCARRCAPPRAAVARWGTPTRSGMFTQLDSGAVTGLLKISQNSSRSCLGLSGLRVDGLAAIISLGHSIWHSSTIRSRTNQHEPMATSSWARQDH